MKFILDNPETISGCGKKTSSGCALLSVSAVITIIAFLFISGCIKPVEKLGCCLKENATEGDDARGCMLYNTTDYVIYNLISATVGLCDDEASGTAGHCNVSFGTDILGNPTYHLVPICSEDELGTCFEPDCQAMVCGDFKYTPRVSPGFTSVDDMEGQVPPETEGKSENFYNAQCRFLDMNSKLTSTMRNSNSLINVFRIGLGSDFVEYDNYRYYLPVSDKFCSTSIPTLEDTDRVDRYMNYIGPNYAKFDPITGINENCIDDGETIPLPFRFGFSSIDDATELGSGVYIYDITDPDRSGYKFREYGRYTIPLDGSDFDPSDTEKAIGFKKIDEGYYRKALTTAYIDDITNPDVGRAAFECDTQTLDCYSGTCDSSFYSRGVLMKGDAADSNTWSSVVSDCTLETDVTGKHLVVCLPTTSITRSGSDISIHYADAMASLWQVKIDVDGYAITDMNEDDASPPEDINGRCEDMGRGHVCSLRWTWLDITGNKWYDDCGFARWGADVRYDSGCEGCDCSNGFIDVSEVLTPQFRVTTLPEFSFTSEDEVGGVCRSGCSWNREVSRCYCPDIVETKEFPPAAQIEFFGKFGEEPYKKVRWTEGDQEYTVLGYALVDPDDFDDLTLIRNCNMDEDDYIQVPIDVPGSDYHFDSDMFTKLIFAFQPYFEHRLEVLRLSNWDDGAGDRMLDSDMIFSSIPWIIAYKRTVFDAEDSPVTSYAANEPTSYYLKRNYLDIDAQNFPGVSSEELRALWNRRGGDDDSWQLGIYVNLMSSYIYLFTDKDNDGKLGDCIIDKSTGLPMVKTYGWCEPCTVSTLAYQAVTAEDTRYIPYQNIDFEGMGGNILCRPNVMHTLFCDSTEIHDLSVYQAWMGHADEPKTGAPRTVPEASYMKEKLENFMKSGVMPVIDLSDRSNWDLTNPFGSVYPEYDSKKLLDNKGAMIVVLYTIESGVSFNVTAIGERANSIRLSCPRCITAVRIREPDNESFAGTIRELFSDPRNYATIDLIAFDYSPNWGDEVGTYTRDDSLNRSIEVVNDIASYARISLVQAGKPTIITNFQVSEYTSSFHGGYWNDDTFDTLYGTIIASQDKLVKAGVIGIIFTPARSDYAISDVGIVGVSDGIGYKGDKFCGFGQAVTRMTSLPKTAMISPMLLQESVNCTACSSLELAIGSCRDGAGMLCDNGASCTIPADSGLDEDNAKCPVNTIAGECQLCEDREGKYICDYNYIDGTYEQKNYTAGEVNSDGYADVIAGLERPEKCCLMLEEGQLYSYSKTAMPDPVNRPVVFSKSGNELQDCGVVGSLAGLDELGFCGEGLPIENYDVSCVFRPG